MSTITRFLCVRIFDPFLFTLGRRHQEANDFLGEMSSRLQKASPRREAAWRQRLLYAAYTSPSAKQSVNNVAASIVKDIVEAVEGLSERSDRQAMITRIRQIVKLAAETWRYAR